MRSSSGYVGWEIFENPGGADASCQVVKLLIGKSSKNATFNNATLLLAEALGLFSLLFLSLCSPNINFYTLMIGKKGGDMKNPTCEGMKEENQVTPTRSLPQSIDIYNVLSKYQSASF